MILDGAEVCASIGLCGSNTVGVRFGVAVVVLLGFIEGGFLGRRVGLTVGLCEGENVVGSVDVFEFGEIVAVATCIMVGKGVLGGDGGFLRFVGLAVGLLVGNKADAAELCF